MGDFLRTCYLLSCHILFLSVSTILHKLWQTRGISPLRRIQLDGKKFGEEGGAAAARLIALSPNGKYFAVLTRRHELMVATVDDGAIVTKTVSPAMFGRCHRPIDAPMAFSPGSDKLLFCADNILVVFDVARNTYSKKEFAIPGKGEWVDATWMGDNAVWCLEWYRDGKKTIACVRDATKRDLPTIRRTAHPGRYRFDSPERENRFLVAAVVIARTEIRNYSSHYLVQSFDSSLLAAILKTWHGSPVAIVDLSEPELFGFMLANVKDVCYRDRNCLVDAILRRPCPPLLTVAGGVTYGFNSMQPDLLVVEHRPAAIDIYDTRRLCFVERILLLKVLSNDVIRVISDYYPISWSFSRWR